MSQFWTLLKWMSFFVEAGAVVKISSNLEPNLHKDHYYVLQSKVCLNPCHTLKANICNLNNIDCSAIRRQTWNKQRNKNKEVFSDISRIRKGFVSSKEKKWTNLKIAFLMLPCMLIFINILLPMFWSQNIAKLNVIREKELNLLLYKKCAPKMLMKLTPCRFSNIYLYDVLSVNLLTDIRLTFAQLTLIIFTLKITMMSKKTTLNSLITAF